MYISKLYCECQAELVEADLRVNFKCLRFDKLNVTKILEMS
jgi:hypothetical protein